MDVAGSVIFLVTGISSVLAAAIMVGAGADPFASWQAVAWSFAAGVCEAGYFTLLVIAFRLAPLGTVYTLSRGFAILAAWPLSVLWLGETVTPLSLGGTVVLLAGLAMNAVKVAASGRAIAVALTSGAFIAGYHLCYKLGIEHGGLPAAVFALSLSVAVPVNLALLPAARRRVLLPVWRARPVTLTALGVVCAASFLLILLALESAGAGYVLTLRNASILFALLLAWQMGERLAPRQWLGAGLIAAGAVLLGLAEH
ncbi:MAG TPA: DMT family transporter [Gammaproteobacteria bacterium]